MARRRPGFEIGEAGAEAAQLGISWAIQAVSKTVAARRSQNRFLSHERYTHWISALMSF